MFKICSQKKSILECSFSEIEEEIENIDANLIKLKNIFTQYSQK